MEISALWLDSLTLPCDGDNPVRFWCNSCFHASLCDLTARNDEWRELSQELRVRKHRCILYKYLIVVGVSLMWQVIQLCSFRLALHNERFLICSSGSSAFVSLFHTSLSHPYWNMEKMHRRDTLVEWEAPTFQVWVLHALVCFILVHMFTTAVISLQIHKCFFSSNKNLY